MVTVPKIAAIPRKPPVPTASLVVLISWITPPPVAPALPAAPRAAPVTSAASQTGAAEPTWLERRTERAETVEVIPRRARWLRIRSKARATLIRAASSVSRRDLPTSANARPSKKRSKTTSRSSEFNSHITSSRTGRRRSQLHSSEEELDEVFTAWASRS